MRLTVSDLCCARGGIPVLDGVSFAIDAGAALVLRGPNGSGKTTLLRTLAGLQPALAGHVSLPPEEVAYAGHADGVKATLTVAENLAFWARIHGTRTVAAALRAFALEGLADRPAANLSAGQRRRLGLARLLVTERPVWALDEPTVSLDTEAVGWFATALRSHLAGGGLALVATHIDLGLSADVLETERFRAAPAPAHATGFDEAFL